MVDFSNVVADNQDAPLKTTLPAASIPDPRQRQTAPAQAAPDRERETQSSVVKYSDIQAQVRERPELVGMGDNTVVATPSGYVNDFIENNVVPSAKIGAASLVERYGTIAAKVGLLGRQEPLTEEQFNEMKGAREIPFDDDEMLPFQARMRIWKYDQRSILNAVGEKHNEETVAGLLQIVGGLAPGIADPVNLGTGVAVGALAKAVSTTGLGQRSAIQYMLQIGDKKNSVVAASLRGSVDAAVSAAPEMYISESFGDEYTRTDLLTDMAASSVLAVLFRAAGNRLGRDFDDEGQKVVSDATPNEILAEQQNTREFMENGEYGNVTPDDVNRTVEAVNKTHDAPVDKTKVEETELPPSLGQEVADKVLTIPEKVFKAVARLRVLTDPDDARGLDNVELVAFHLEEAQHDVASARMLAEVLYRMNIIDESEIPRVTTAIQYRSQLFNDGTYSPDDAWRFLGDAVERQTLQPEQVETMPTQKTKPKMETVTHKDFADFDERMSDMVETERLVQDAQLELPFGEVRERVSALRNIAEKCSI